MYEAWGGRKLLYGSEFLTDRGYTGHEHLEPLGLIDMNGRIYDPTLARFLSPDPYVQAPDFTQSFNRYSYCWNNPFKYTDPEGEWVHIVIGAAIGGVMNLALKAIQGDINSWGDGFAAFGIGAAAGAIGALSGGATFAAAGGAAGGAGGFLAGAAGGAASTAFSSPVLNMGNAAYFGDPLMSPGQYLIGVAVGGALGGVTNGITASVNDKGFWTGNVPTPSAPTPPVSVPKPQISDAPDLLEAMAEKYPEKVLDVPKIYNSTSNNPSLGNSFQPIKDIEGNIIGYTREIANTNVVYQGVDAAGNVRYVGITSRPPAVRFAEHAASGTARSALQYRVIDGATGLTRTQARIWEQILINNYGMQKNGGLLLNKINSIAPKHWWMLY